MHSGEADIFALAAALADGAAVDWDQVESSAADDKRQIVEQFRQLARLRDVARLRAAAWGPLEIRSEVGRGTFGTVYRAWDPRLDREVALKLLHLPDAAILDSVAIREGRLLARVRDPHVVTVYGADIHDGVVGIWMEFITGRTLRDIVTTDGPFGAHEAAVIGRDLCRALTTVHQQGFVHRDVKAQNVMRAAGGRTVLMDFGAGEAVTQSTPGASAGTPAYLAPEVLAGAAPDARSDIYSLGVLLYFLVSGTFPVIGNSLDDLRTRHGRGERTLLRDVRAGLPDALVHAIDRALDADPSRRPASAGAMASLLDAALQDETRPVVETSSTRPSIVLRPWRSRAMVVIAAGIVVAAVGIDVYHSRRTAATVPVRNSIAVMAFTNGSGTDNGYLSDGLTRDVAQRLGALADLRVISGASLQPFRGDQPDAPKLIGQALGAMAVLQARVESAAGRIKLAARLVDAKTGEEVWADVFDRELTDIVGVETEFTRKVAIVMRGELSARESERLREGQSANDRAFLSYLRARREASFRTDEALTRSIGLYEQALSIDSKYALAYSGLADAYISLGAYGSMPRSVAYARANDAAAKAVALAPNVAEAHLTLAQSQKNRFEWEAAEVSYKRAIALRPTFATAHHWYSIYLMQMGRFSESIAEVRRAIELDRESVGANLHMAAVLMFARRYEDAVAQYQHALQMQAGIVNGYRGLGTAYTYMGLFDRARAAFSQAVALMPRGAEDQELKADFGYLQAVSGHRAEALEIAKALAARYQDAREPVAVSVAAIYAGLGDANQVSVWLERALKVHDPDLGFLKVDPRWDAVQTDRRFQQYLISLNLSIPPNH
jgi:eukaryotic-like serine/threonine-protein kinase